MCISLTDLLNSIINVVFETFYICCWIIFIQKQYDEKIIQPLREKIKVISKKQDILFKSINNMSANKTS